MKRGSGVGRVSGVGAGTRSGDKPGAAEESGVAEMEALASVGQRDKRRNGPGSGPGFEPVFDPGFESGPRSGCGCGTGSGVGYPPIPDGARGLTGEQERVLLEHLPVVRFLARRIHERLPQHVEMEDLVSAGIVGLMDAFAKFDPEKKVQFRSYAQFRIRGAILDSLRTLDWSPRELRRKGRAVEEAVRVLTARLGRPPGEGEVAGEMELSLDEYQQLLGDLKGLEIGTLHIEHNEDSGEEELAYVPGRPEDDPLFCCLRGELEERLAGAINNLPDRERLVMTLYYYEEMTMREIGMALGVVESRVSQVHASAVVHLRAVLKDLAVQGAFGRSAAAKRGAHRPA